MGYKEDKELYEEYMGALVDSDASFQQRKEKMEEIFGEDVGLDHVNSAFEYIAKVEYIEPILKSKAELASRYEIIHATNIESTKSEEGTDIKRKTKIISLMNGMVKFFNSIHNNSNPIALNETRDVILINSLTPSTPKNFVTEKGTMFELDESHNFSISSYEKKDNLMVKCGNMAITVSKDLVDIQFGDKEGIIISKDSEDCKYYKLPENREMLLKTRNYQLNPEWYTEDLTDELISRNGNITSIISPGILHINSKSLREEMLQNTNILLSTAKIPTITDISQEGISIIMEKAKVYHNQKESEIEKLKSDKTKSENEKIEMQEEIARLKKENSELQDALETERAVWSKIPIIGKIIAKRIESKKKKSLPPGDAPVANLPDTLQDVKVEVKDIDSSQAKVEKSDKEREQRIK